MLCQTCDTRNLDDARFCAYCGTQLVAFQQPALAPQPRRFARLRTRRWVKYPLLFAGGMFALVTACATIGEMTSSHSPRTVQAGVISEACATESEVATDEDATIPEQQAEFIQTVEHFAQSYQGAENKLQRTQQRLERNEALATLLPERTVEQWTGTLKSLDTNATGNAFITVQLDGAESISVSTWDNALRDEDTKSLIQPGSDLYKTLATLNAGDRVTFRGTFAENDQNYIVERNGAEGDVMTAPDFVMVFSEITPQE